MEYRPNGRLGRSTSPMPGLGSIRAEGAGELLLERTKTLQAGCPASIASALSFEDVTPEDPCLP